MERTGERETAQNENFSVSIVKGMSKATRKVCCFVERHSMESLQRELSTRNAHKELRLTTLVATHKKTFT